MQSAAIAALIVQGKIRPDLAVIVDTEREKSSTWAYMDDVISPALASVGVVLHRVKKSEFATVDLYGGANRDTLLIPAFTTQSGEVGKLQNFCSGEWKRRVVQRWVRAQGVKRHVTWLGISADEKHRMQAGGATRYPLIELGRNRGDCVALVRKMGWSAAPRSSCWKCPNQHQLEWRDMRDNHKDDWSLAVKFDREMRERDPHAFLHADCVPLDKANLDDANGVLFSHCESGMCFV